MKNRQKALRQVMSTDGLTLEMAAVLYNEFFLFPEMYEKVNGKKLDGADLEAYYSIAAAWAQASKSMLLPEGTPDAIVRAYRKAVTAMVNDPEFKEKATKALGPYPLIIGDEAGPILKKAAIFSDSTKEQLNAVLKKNRFVYRVQ